MASRIPAKPTAYVLTINGDVVEEAGNNGLIAKYEVADEIRNVLAAQYPDKDVILFGCFMVKR